MRKMIIGLPGSVKANTRGGANAPGLLPTGNI
ncbi:hypothetical protein FHS10_001517 [Mucilaginibacter dorajii]|nr:hypothetical protein [Mucilaginibacter dorajii]